MSTSNQIFRLFGRRRSNGLLSSVQSEKASSNNNNSPTEVNSEGFWKRMYKPFGLFFGRKPVSNLPVTQDVPQPAEGKNMQDSHGAPPNFKEININIEETELLLAPEIDKFIRERGDEFWLMGLNDGIRGVNPTAIDEVAQAHAVTLVEYVRASSEGKLKSFKKDAGVKFKIMRDEEDRYRDAQKHLEDMTHYYHTSPKSFSIFLFRMYLAIAIFLIIADIPLAMILTEKGFDLQSESVASILLTLGIAFCAVYIKIYYDDYIANTLGFYVNQFKKIPGIIGDRVRKKSSKDSITIGYSENTEELQHKAEKEIKITHVEFWIKFGIKSSILLITLYTIWTLGKFRYQNISNPEREIIMEYVNWVMEKMGGDPQQTTREAFNTTLRAFRLITLVFPIIGGVCLSLALSNIQNIKRLKVAEQLFEKLQVKFLNALKNYNEARRKYEDYQGIFDRWNEKASGSSEDEHTSFFKKVFKSYYTLGFENGMTGPDMTLKNLDLYGQIEIVRRKIVAKRSQKALHKS